MTRLSAYITLFFLFSGALNTHAEDNNCKSALTKIIFKESGAIPAEWVEKMKTEELSKSQNRMNHAVQNAGFLKVAMNRDVLIDHNTTYTKEVALGCPTHQKQSGRCWIFAGNNMLRAELTAAKKIDKNFSLSHTYLHFFNMLEKSNRWLWNVEESQLQNLSRRDELKFIENDPFGDGGWYQWYQFLVAKYGMVPQQAMPDTESSINTSTLNHALKIILSAAGMQIKQMTSSWNAKSNGTYTKAQRDKLLALRQETMSKIFRVLETHLGTPPSTFKFTNAEEKTTASYTPHTFRDNFVQYKPDDYVTVSNNARHPRNQFYELSRSTIGVPESNGNSYPIQMLNMPFERIDELLRNSIDAGFPMWFATDVGKFLEATPASLSKPGTGIWHPDIFKHAEVFGLEEHEFKLDSITQTEFRLSIPNHAMVIVAYDKPDENSPTIKYKIENSWGKEWADEGFGHMYRQWAELYLAEVVIRKSLLTEKELSLINAQPKIVSEDDYY